MKVLSLLVLLITSSSQAFQPSCLDLSMTISHNEFNIQSLERDIERKHEAIANAKEVLRTTDSDSLKHTIAELNQSSAKMAILNIKSDIDNTVKTIEYLRILEKATCKDNQ